MKLSTYLVPGFPLGLFEALAEAIDADLHVVEGSSGPEFPHNPFASGEADLGWVCSTSYADLLHRDSISTVALAGLAWVPVDEDARGLPVYFSDVVVRSDSLTESLAGLAGKRVGCNDRISLSGHHALRIALRRRGEDLDTFAKPVFTGGHRVSLTAVIDGEVDAAVVDSVVRLSRMKTDPDVAALRVIERIGPWPTQPLIVRSSMPKDDLHEVRRRLLAAGATPRVKRELEAAGIAKLVTVGKDHCQPVIDALAE